MKFKVWNSYQNKDVYGKLNSKFKDNWIELLCS